MPVWQSAMKIAVAVFNLTDGLPRKEDYGLTSQLRRSGLSISDNIAEGFGREGMKDKRMFYIYARGSANESKNQLIYGEKVGYFKTEEVNQLKLEINSTLESLNKLIKTFSTPTQSKS